MCFECRKPAHFKEHCSRIKKKHEEKELEKKKLKKKSAWKVDKKKKASKAIKSDLSDDEKNEQGTKDNSKLVSHG